MQANEAITNGTIAGNISTGLLCFKYWQENFRSKSLFHKNVAYWKHKPLEYHKSNRYSWQPATLWNGMKIIELRTLSIPIAKVKLTNYRKNPITMDTQIEQYGQTINQYLNDTKHIAEGFHIHAKTGFHCRKFHDDVFYNWITKSNRYHWCTCLKFENKIHNYKN